MISLKPSMDLHSRRIERNGKEIGHLEWHPEGEPRIILYEAGEDLSIDQMELILTGYRQIRKNDTK